MVSWILTLLVTPVLGSPVGEWLCGELDFDPADDACPRFFRE